VDEILQRIKEAGIPTVSMDNKVEGLIHIGIDNRSAMKEITKHFIQVHKFTKFNYISGPQDNPESSDRLAAFLEVLDEYNLTIEPDRIFYGDFRGDSAKEAIDKFIQSGMEMPQAIICANDVMAAAAVNQLHNSGIKIPDEIAVSGFDDVFDSYNLRVELTTVKRPLIRSGKLACKMLEQKFNNCLETNNKMLNMTARFSESCGCKKCESPVAKIYKEANIANFNRIDLNNHYMYHIYVVILNFDQILPH
jgi:DNA-binding LacI/PurR family transcriptional regulator